MTVQTSFNDQKKSFPSLRVSSDVMKNRKSQDALQQFQFKTQEVLNARQKLAQIRESKKIESRFDIQDNKVYENINIQDSN